MVLLVYVSQQQRLGGSNDAHNHEPAAGPIHRRLFVSARCNGGPGRDVAAVRQNLGLLVDRAAITPEVNSTTTNTWGGHCRQRHLCVALSGGDP